MATTILSIDQEEGILDATATLGAANDTFGEQLDLDLFQSIMVQVSGTFSGTLTYEVSVDGTNWVAKSLTSPSGAFTSTTTGPTIAVGDIGARLFRVRFSAYTSGTARVDLYVSRQSISYNSNQSVISSGTISAVLAAVHSQPNLSTTNLGANATYTGGTVDGGTTTNTLPTLVRPYVRHLAGNVHGHLILQESLDGTTWVETRRTPVPSDGLYHTFEFPIHMRYHRLLFTNGATAQTGFHIGSILTRGDGPSIDMKAVLSFVLSTTPLAISATFTSPTLDLGGNHDWNLLRAYGFADVAGGANGFRIEWSHDGTTWRFMGDAAPITPSASGNHFIESRVQGRYARIIWVNSTTVQTAFMVNAHLVSL